MRARRKVSVAIDAREVIGRAVLEGAEYGWRRAHKHSDAPSKQRVVETMSEEIMTALDDVVRWDR